MAAMKSRMLGKRQASEIVGVDKHDAAAEKKAAMAERKAAAVTISSGGERPE